MRNVTHTEWCDPTECDAELSGWHSSTRWTVGRDSSGMDSTITVHVTKLGAVPPFVDLTAYTPALDETDTDDEEYPILLTPERAVALGHLLINAGQTATRQIAG